MIEEKIRTHQGRCIMCGNVISEERIEKDYNEPFCSERCKRSFYEENNLPETVGFKFVRHFSDVSFAIISNTHKPPFLFQKVILYDIETGLPEGFRPLKGGQ